jgi:peroxiredoxin
LVLFLLLSIPTQIHAQEINLHFPHFTGHHYNWKIFQGEKELSVRSGEIPPDGRVSLVMPEAHQAYRGMTRWLLKSGGGLDMIYTGNGFSAECLSEQPGPETIIYTGNPENDYLATQHRHQQTILDRLGAINHLLQVYPPDEDLHKMALKEQESLRRHFEKIQAERSKNPLYAARFGEIVDFIRGVADKVYENQEDHIHYFNEFVTHSLNFQDLYTSGHWDQVLHHWLMMNLRSQDSDQGIKNRMNAALNRMNKDDILSAFIQKAVPLLVKEGKDDLLPGIVSHLDKHPDARAKLPDNVKHMMASIKILTDKKASDIVLKAPVWTQTGRSAQDITLETGKLNADYTILLFYQGECPLCEDALIDLANQYKRLSEQKVRVIAVSGDTTEQGFEKKLNYHQWLDNYCDFTGMNGINFKNYGVLGIPTLFLLDKEGMVLEKSATVEDVIKHINNGI